MINRKIWIIPAFFIILISLLSSHCAAKKSVKYLKQKITPGSSIVIIVDCPTNIQNVILTKFMSKDFKVKAFNASDLYTVKEVFDIKDFKKVAGSSSLNDIDKLFSMQKTYDNIYKLNIYNYEINKAESLAEMKDKYNVKYLLLFDLKDWEHVSWGRLIDLNTYELAWVENYAVQYKDTLETVIDHFINSLYGN
jgi:hypothetical protein